MTFQKTDAVERFWSKVQQGEGCWDWRGSIWRSTGYGRYWNGDRTMSAHRYSFELANGPIPTGMVVDHICHTKTCVRPDHLRLATTKQNGEYRQGAASNNRSSGLRGVTLHRQTGRWQAQLTHNGRSIYCGLHDSPEQAAESVRAKRRELFTFEEAL